MAHGAGNPGETAVRGRRTDVAGEANPLERGETGRDFPGPKAFPRVTKVESAHALRSEDVRGHPGHLYVAKRSQGFPRSRRHPLRRRLAIVVIGVLGALAVVLVVRAAAAPHRLPEVAMTPRSRPVTTRRPSVQIRTVPPPPVPTAAAEPEAFRGMGGGCGSGYVHDLIVAKDWDDVEALQVASRESGCNPNAANPYSSASGVFQLVAFWWNGENAYGWVFDPFSAAANVDHAYLMWQADGGSFCPGQWCV